MPPVDRDQTLLAKLDLDALATDYDVEYAFRKFTDSIKYRIHLDEAQHPAVAVFATVFDLSTVLRSATTNVMKHLYQKHGEPPAIRSVTLVLEDMGGVAYTTGIALDNDHKEIHVSLSYLANKIDQLAAFRAEAFGVLTHEMVHVWQHNGLGTAPGGLIEGVADFVRLKAGLSPPHWQKNREHAGDAWDAGYEKTAWFLEWLEDQFGAGSVQKINAHLAGRTYDETRFWRHLFGTDVDELWKEYLAHWDETSAAEARSTGTSSVASSDTEIVNLTEEEKVVARIA